MKHLSLASRYRPQKFAEVIGQELATAALSRAASLDRVAPAYLLSGTRGVGKTTIARIFAKALNCEHAPAPEPCDTCAQCEHIALGNHVDVNEIDGASNTGVDDVRALRENIGFSPMEGRYKIFIVDEAHMLSKSAFNALLKTLEEPPPHTVFIFATTEAHRFPATIVSRCQHFVFRHLPEELIHDHLAKILAKEKITFEDVALKLVARRAQGSVRDSLSLLDQVLSLSGGSLDAETTRLSLGLAGLDFYGKLFMALAARDCGQVVDLCATLLSSGVDIGFFIRELAGYFRNLFLLRQMGENFLTALKLSPDECSFLKKQAPAFSLAHLHAAWQMILDSQRAIAQSPEPGVTLELLLINLAILPRLLPIGEANPVALSPNPAESAVNAPIRPVAENHGKDHGVAAAPSPEYCQNSPAGQEGAEGWKMEEPQAPATCAVQEPGGETGRDWRSFCEYCHSAHLSDGDVPSRDILKGLEVDWREGGIKIYFTNKTQMERLAKKKNGLQKSLRLYCGGVNVPEIEFIPPKPERSQTDMVEECRKKPELKLCQEILGASISECREKKREKSNEKYE